jgi:predicted DNA-binding protein (UPF0251 family)
VDYIDIVEAAKRAGVSDKTLRRAIESGKLVTQARTYRNQPLMIAVTDFDAYLASRHKLPRHDDLSRLDVPRRIKEMTSHVQIDRLDTSSHVKTNVQLRIDELEQRVKKLEEIVQTLTSQASSHMPRHNSAIDSTVTRHSMDIMSKQMTRQETLPEGCITLVEFARRHHVANATFRDHVTRGIGKEKERVQVTERPKPGRPHETERYLTPEQQQAALDYWRRHGVKFSEP